MRLSIIIVTLLISMTCCSQDNYEYILSIRLKEIEKLQVYENSFVVYNETQGYGFLLDHWRADLDYYQDDMVLDNSGKRYRVLIDNKGKNPKTSPNEWKLMPWIHPYFFLRDTATIEDLRKLLTHEHPYIKTFAFGALAHKAVDGLFDVIIDNLGDKTRIKQFTSDFGFDVFPADLMISYELDDLTKEERVRLQKLIESKYDHLKYARELLADK